MSDGQDIVSKYKGLVDKVDAHTTRVSARHADKIKCRAGCTACCRQELSVSRVEAERIMLWLGNNVIPERDDSKTPHDEHDLFYMLAGARPCTFLAPGGVCGIYPVRPLICRTHGLPIKAPDGSVGACPMNFTEGVEKVPKEDVINLALLNKTLSLIEVLHARQIGEEEPGRFRLADLRRLAEEMEAEP